eukprot:jgi/Bigna1/72899/fgenesh1_pg.22_\
MQQRPSTVLGQISTSSDILMIEDTTTEMTKIVGKEGLPNGKLLEWMDITACMSAEKFSGMSSVTAAMDDVHMDYDPEYGDAVIVYTQVNRAFRTSMEVGCKVFAETLLTGKKRVVCRAFFTFVSLGPDKKKRVLPKLSPGNDQENMRRYAQALERRQLRLERRKLIEDTFKSLLTRIRSTSDIEPPPPLVEVEKKDEKERIGMVAELDGKDHTDQKKQRGGGGKRSIGMGVVVVQEDEDDGNDDAAPGVTSSRRDNPINNSLLTMVKRLLPLQRRMHHKTCLYQQEEEEEMRAVILAATASLLVSEEEEEEKERGSVSAHRFTRQKMILRFIDQISFINPVMLADRFSVKSQVNHCFHDSVEVGVRAETHSLGQASKHALSAYFIFEHTDLQRPIKGFQSNILYLQIHLQTHVNTSSRRNKEALGRKRVRIKREQVVTNDVAD